MKTLNFLIVRLIGGLLLLTFVAIMSVVWFSLNKHANAQIQKNIQIGKKVLQQTLVDRESMLTNSAQVLAADFGFKQAVATQDIATIESVLQNHGDRIGAELMVLLDLEGNYLASASINGERGISANYQKEVESLDSSQTSNILLLDKIFYQCVIVEVKTPLPIARALIGFRLDRQFVENLKALTNLEVSLLKTTKVKNEKEKYIDSYVSTIDVEREGNIGDLIEKNFDSNFLFASKDKFYSESFLLSKNDGAQTKILLSENVSRQFNDFQLLQLNVLMIAFVALTLTLILGAVFSKKLSKPLYRMVEKTKKIAQGVYQSSINVKNDVYEISQLANSIDSMRHDIAERQSKIEFMATHDSLTGLSNRFQFESFVNHNSKQCSSFLIVGLKLKNLKTINLSFGHLVGDGYISSVSKGIAGLEGDVAYLGAGEFVWLPNANFELTELLAIKRKIESPYVIDETQIEARFSLGVLHANIENDSVEGILRKLSLCVESANTTREPYLVYQDEMERVFKERVNILNELEKVLQSSAREISINYQPKIALDGELPPKMEALIRWTSEQLGFVSPEVFIPIAEAAGLINRISRLVIGRVIQDIKEWQSEGVEITVAINLSAQDVENDEILEFIKERLFEASLDKSYVAFEITEGELINNEGETREILSQFRESGFTLSIDDFGTGYSSMSYLKSLPVNELKIDKSFVLNLDADKQDQEIVKAILSLAKSFSFKTVAEGIESKNSLDFLKQYGCNWAQGYFISKPMPKNLVVGWVKEYQRGRQADIQ